MVSLAELTDLICIQFQEDAKWLQGGTGVEDALFLEALSISEIVQQRGGHGLLGNGHAMLAHGGRQRLIP